MKLKDYSKELRMERADFTVGLGRDNGDLVQLTADPGTIIDVEDNAAGVSAVEAAMHNCAVQAIVLKNGYRNKGFLQMSTGILASAYTLAETVGGWVGPAEGIISKLASTPGQFQTGATIATIAGGLLAGFLISNAVGNIGKANQLDTLEKIIDEEELREQVIKNERARKKLPQRIQDAISNDPDYFMGIHNYGEKGEGGWDLGDTGKAVQYIKNVNRHKNAGIPVKFK